MRFDAWVAVGQRVARISNVSAWWLGDWLLFGQRAYPQRYRAACDATSLDYQTLRNYASVAGRVGVSRRRYTLSFQHHAEVASMSGPDQDLWLSRADSGGWSRNELRRRIAAARKERASDAEQVCVRLEVAAERGERWRVAAATAGLEFVDWMASAIDAAADAVLRETVE
jgi:hypothetical protein